MPVLRADRHPGERPQSARCAARRERADQESAHRQGDDREGVGSGKVSATDVAGFVFDAIAENRFYVYSHPRALSGVQTRLEDIVQIRNPTDPFAGKPEIGAALKKALRDSA